MPFEFERHNDSSHRNALDTTSTICFSDAYDQTCKTIQASAREVALVTAGSVGGAVDEIQKDPAGTLSRAATTFAVGAGLGALAAAETPIIAAGAVAAGAIWTGMWAVDTLNPYEARNQARFSKIGSALNDVWNHGDASTFDTSLQKMKEGAGPIALDVGLMAVGGQGAQFGAKHIPGLAAKFGFLHGKELAPASIPSYYNARANESWFDLNDFTLFKKRSGRARVDQGPPETVDARLAKMDNELGIMPRATKFEQHHRDVDVSNVLTPAQKKHVPSFYFDSRYRVAR